MYYQIVIALTVVRTDTRSSILGSIYKHLQHWCQYLNNLLTCYNVLRSVVPGTFWLSITMGQNQLYWPSVLTHTKYLTLLFCHSYRVQRTN